MYHVIIGGERQNLLCSFEKVKLYYFIEKKKLYFLQILKIMILLDSEDIKGACTSSSSFHYHAWST